MATDQLYKQISQDPQLFLYFYKFYIYSRYSSQVVKKDQQHDDKSVQVIDDQQAVDQNEDEEEDIVLIEEEDEDYEDEVVIVEKQKVEKQVEVNQEFPNITKEINNSNTTLLDHLKKLLGGRTALSSNEFLSLFEGGELGLFFQQVADQQFYSFEDLVHFLLNCVFIHPDFSNIQKFPITLRVTDLLHSNRKQVIQSLIGCDISYLEECLAKSYQLLALLETMKLTFDLKLRGSSQAVTKMFLTCPSFDFKDLFGEIVNMWYNLEEIDCGFYSLIVAPVDLKPKEKAIIEVTIRDQIHPSIVEDIITFCPRLAQLNVNLKFWLEYSHLVRGLKHLTLGVLIPSGQSKLFKLLFKGHKLGSYPYYPVEDPLIELNDFRKIWSEELAIIGKIYDLQENVLSLNRSSSKLPEEDRLKVKTLVKKVDRLVDRIDEAESLEFIEKFEECWLEFDDIKML